MPNLDDVIPHITEQELGRSDASLYGTYPGTLRNALRKAGDDGLTIPQIRVALRCEGEELDYHMSAVRNAIEYLVAVGLAVKRPPRLFDVPVTTKRNAS